MDRKERTLFIKQRLFCLKEKVLSHNVDKVCIYTGLSILGIIVLIWIYRLLHINEAIEYFGEDRL